MLQFSTLITKPFKNLPNPINARLQTQVRSKIEKNKIKNKKQKKKTKKKKKQSDC